MTVFAVCLVLAPLASAGDVAGLWDFVFETETGERRVTFEFTVDGNQVTARAGEMELTGTFEAEALELSGEFTPAEAGYPGTLEIKGELVDGHLEGDGSWEEYPFTFKATKQ